MSISFCREKKSGSFGSVPEDLGSPMRRISGLPWEGQEWGSGGAGWQGGCTQPNLAVRQHCSFTNSTLRCLMREV